MDFAYNMMDEYFVRDIMKKDLIKVAPSSTIRDAAKTMTENKVGCVIVIENENPIGIVTESDFVRRVAVNGKPVSSPVKEIMSHPLISIDADATIWELAEKMKLDNIRKIPVIQDNKMIGIVTTTDIARLCSIGSDSEMRMVCQQILQRLSQS